MWISDCFHPHTTPYEEKRDAQKKYDDARKSLKYAENDLRRASIRLHQLEIEKLDSR